MKKLSLFLVGALLMGLTSCGHSMTQTGTSIDKRSHIEYSYVEDVNTMEDVIRYSTNIVEATLISAEDFDGVINVYHFKVNTDYTGNTADEIYMYDEYNENYVVDHTYYLFLCGSDNALYPHTIYTTVVKDLIIDSESIQPTATALYGELTVKTAQTETAISTAIETGIVGERIGQQLDISTSSIISSVSNEADVIAEIRISNELPANRFASTYEVELVNLLKGPYGSVASVMALPPDLDSNLTYYVMLKEDPGFPNTYCLFSRVYPVMDATESNLSQISLADK